MAHTLSERLQSFPSWLAAHREPATVLGSGAFIVAAWGVRLASVGLPPGGPYTLLMVGAAAIAGARVASEAVARLRARRFSIALLVIVASAGAVWIGEAWEAAAVTFLYVLGGYLEGITLARTRSALRGLVDLAPRTARVIRGGEVVIVPAEAVLPGETVVVLPGDRVPVDGKVVGGRAVLDTAPLTGEPLPAEAGPGDSVLGGSVSRGGHLEVEAVRVGPDTTFSRLVYLVAEAQEQRPKVQRTLDAFARWYTPLIITASGGLLALTRDVRLALTFLVIACPGALVMASPVAVVAGLGHAARRGILIKGGERLERIARLDTVALDKTGTLTLGRPAVQTVLAFGGDGGEGSDAWDDRGPGEGAGGADAKCERAESERVDGELIDKGRPQPDRRRVLALAAAAEQRSEHHLATAILGRAREEGVEPVSASDWRLEPGLGAVADGGAGVGEILAGNRRLLAAHGVELTAGQQAALAARESAGETVALVAAGGRAVGLIGITDPVRPEAHGLAAELRRAGVRRTVMLTGDNERSAVRVAALLGIDEVRAGLLPGEKVAAIRDLQAQGRVVGMVGDGVNDAPALSAADVSIAMGASGTQAAAEAADIALMTDRLGQVPYAIRLSRRILGVIRQNVAFAVAVVGLLILGVLGHQVHLAGGMLVHEASVLLVIANGMRLLRPPAWERAPRKAMAPSPP